MDMSLHTILLTVSPVITMGWSFLLWGSRLSLQEMGSGLLGLGGVVVVTLYRARAPRSA
jgi:drug/metabolite transporter (DMT)-like permease